MMVMILKIRNNDLKLMAVKWKRHRSLYKLLGRWRHWKLSVVCLLEDFKHFTHYSSMFVDVRWCLCVFRAALIHSMNIKWCIKSDLLISWFSTQQNMFMWESLNPSCMFVYHEGDARRDSFLPFPWSTVIFVYFDVPESNDCCQ